MGGDGCRGSEREEGGADCDKVDAFSASDPFCVSVTFWRTAGPLACALLTTNCKSDGEHVSGKAVSHQRSPCTSTVTMSTQLLSARVVRQHCAINRAFTVLPIADICNRT